MVPSLVPPSFRLPEGCSRGICRHKQCTSRHVLQQPALQHPRRKRHTQRRQFPPAPGNCPCSLFGLKTKPRRSQDQSDRTSNCFAIAKPVSPVAAMLSASNSSKVGTKAQFVAHNSLKAPHQRFAPHPQEHSFTKRNKTRRAHWLPCQGGRAGRSCSVPPQPSFARLLAIPLAAGLN